MHKEPHTIVAGKGVGTCCIGANKLTAVNSFGLPARISLGADYALKPGWLRCLVRRYRLWWTACWARIRNRLVRQAEASSDLNLAGGMSERYESFDAGGNAIPNYLVYPSLGFEVVFDDDGKITSLFFNFRGESHQSFNGRTNLGIGIASTEDDVLKRYGTPTHTSKYREEKNVGYEGEGITFVFANSLLKAIFVNKPKATWWPPEWPARTYTPNIDWLAFKPARLTGPVMDAQASFLEFARVAEQDRLQPSANFQAIWIQAFFETTTGNPIVGEFVYLSDVHTDGKKITATVVSPAVYRTDLTEGREVTFPIEYLSDWYLVPVGVSVGLGGFCVTDELALPSSEPSVRSSPVRWFSHRNRISAADELFAIPQCVRCNKRYLGIEPNLANEICYICRQGGRRCDCPRCGAPLIRLPHQSAECVRCAKYLKGSGLSDTQQPVSF